MFKNLNLIATVFKKNCWINKDTETKKDRIWAVKI